MTTRLQFKRAAKEQSRLRMAIDGPSGAGKTYTALLFAHALAEQIGGRVAVIDTEHASASKYADLFPPYDVLEMDEFSPALYTEAIRLAESAGYSVLIIDSLSHAWDGSGGALEMVDDAAARSRAGNSYTAWRDVTPLHRRMVEAILQSSCHIIATMRSRMEYIMQEETRNGRTVQVPRKVGLAPIQRQGMEYEFDIVADMDIDHRLVVSKSRCFAVADNVTLKPKGDWLQPVIAWLTSGEPVKAEVTPTEPEPKVEPEQGEPERKTPPRTWREQAESTAEPKAHWSIDRNGAWRGFISQAATYRGFDMTDDTYHGMLREQWGVEHTAQLPNDYAACQKAALAWMNSKAGVPAGKN